MFDLSLERDFLTIWLLFMGIVFCYGLWIWGKMKREMTQSRKALEDLKRWSRRYPEFSAGVYHGGEAAEISDPTLNPKIRKWLKQFWAGHRQNKPPIVDEVIGKEEDHLCNNDDTLRTISGSLIILGLLGTFIGLFLVIIPIQSIIQNTQDIIQNTQDSAKTTGPAVAQSMTEMLKKIGGSLSGMKFAFLTSIVGLGLMIVLNFLFSIFIGKKRHVLLDELETHFNEDIAPRFRLFSPETQLEEAVNRAFKSLADRHSEFMAGQEDYLKRTLEAHFDRVSAAFEPLFQKLGDTSDTFKAASEKWHETIDDFSARHSEFMAGQEDYLKRALEAHLGQVSESLTLLFQTLGDTSDTLNAASASSQRASEIWQKTLDDFSDQHSQFMADQGNYLKRALEAHFEKISVSLEPLLQTLHRASDTLNAASASYYQVSEDWSATFSQGAEAVREAGEAFVKHISNFTKLSEPLEELKAAVEKMVGDFEKRIEALALTMGETYQVLQKLNPDEPPYQLVFDHIKARLDAIHNTEQDLLRFQQISNREDEADMDERVKALRQSLLSVESAIEDLRETLVENLTVVNQTLNDFPEVLRQQRRIIGLLTDMDVLPDRPKRLKRWMSKLKGLFNRTSLE